MGGLSIWHILIVALLFVLLFGKGKISDLMGDVAKGVKSFKKGMADDEPAPAPQKEAAKPRAKPKTKAAAKVTAKPTLAIEDKSGKPAAKPAPRKRKVTKS
jgi:sec-independent protein translocase protein TatA